MFSLDVPSLLGILSGERVSCDGISILRGDTELGEGQERCVLVVGETGVASRISLM